MSAMTVHRKHSVQVYWPECKPKVMSPVSAGWCSFPECRKGWDTSLRTVKGGGGTLTREAAFPYSSCLGEACNFRCEEERKAEV